MTGDRVPGDRKPADGRPLRVLVVTLGRFGGVTEYGWMMARALAARTEIAAVYSASAENRRKWEELDVPRLEVPTFASIPGMLLSLLDFPRFARIRRFAREFDPDIIYYPGGHAFKPLLDMVLPRRARVVLTVHDPQLHEGEDSLLFRLLDSVNRIRVHGYVLLNEVQREGFIARRRLDPAAVTVIPLGVFDGLPQADAAQSTDARRDLLFIGRIRPYKGIGVLLQAFRDAKIDPAIPLVIAGSGDFSAEETALLREVAHREVRVVNRWLEPEEIPELVARARFVVLPYTSATQSGIVPLSSAFGVPAIASATGGIVEQVEDGRTGLLFPAADPAALASAIEQAYSMDDASYLRMARECREHATRKWAWDGLAAKLLDFMRKL